MKKILFTSLTIFLMACGPKYTSRIAISNEATFGDVNVGIPQLDTFVVHLNGADTMSYGHYGLSNERELSIYKTGYWKSFYPNNILKEEGEYRIGHYINCCFAGACMQYYHYKIGKWKYYDSNGNLKCKVAYIPSTLHKDTNCEGGDQVKFGLIKHFSKLAHLYNLTVDEIYQLQKVVLATKDPNRQIILIPISGELVFEYHTLDGK